MSFINASVKDHQKAKVLRMIDISFRSQIQRPLHGKPFYLLIVIIEIIKSLVMY